MDKKILLAAMAFPMLFTACSQDELLDEVAGGIQVPEARGYYMTLDPVLGDAASRAQWLESGHRLDWDSTDKISVYWLGGQETSGMGTKGNLKGLFNSVFKTTDGNGFTSESMVFEGGNVAVFPADLAFTKQQDIYLTVPKTQNADVIKNVPYISNYVKIEANPKLEEQIPGYNEGLYSPMKMAANVLELDIELANTEGLAAYNFKVESVSLVTKTEGSAVNGFAERAALKIDGTPDDTHELSYNEGGKTKKVKTITKSIRTAGIAEVNTLTTTNITPKGNGKYHVKFVVLPTLSPAASSTFGTGTFDETSEIVIYTNCGRINLTTTSKIGNEAATNLAEYPGKDELAENQVIEGALTDQNGEKETIKQMLEKILSSRTMEATASSNFNGEKVGRPYVRTVQADMSHATLNDSPVKSSDEILNYVSIYKAMKSTEPMNLVLSSEEEDGDTFVDLTREAIGEMDGLNNYNVVDGVKATLSMAEEMTKVQLAEGGEVYFNDDAMWKGVGDNALTMVLPAGVEWTMDDAASYSKVGTIESYGDLTINGTSENKGQNVLEELVKNYGTLYIGGNNTLKVGHNLKNMTTEDVEGVIEIALGQELLFNEDVTEGIEGIINVAQGGFLTVDKGVTVTSDAEINNAGTVSSDAGQGGMYNEGIINVVRNGSMTYVQDNKVGVINLLSRNNEVVVNNNPGKIVYNYTAADGDVFERVLSDKFTYVVFGSETPVITLVNKQRGEGRDDAMLINDISFEFTDETIVYANSTEVNDVIVGNEANLQFMSVTPTDKPNVLYAHCVKNEGIITVGGTIYYFNDYSGNGRERSVGHGAVVYDPVKVTSSDELVAAAKAGKNMILETSGLTLTESLKVLASNNVTIDLNNKILNSTADVAVALEAGAALEIKNGEMNVSVTGVRSYGDLTLTNCDIISASNGSSNMNSPVDVLGGNLVIDGGKFMVSTPTADSYAISIVDCESAKLKNVKAKSNGALVSHRSKVTINGGTFEGSEFYGLFIYASDVTCENATLTGKTGEIYVAIGSQNLSSKLNGKVITENKMGPLSDLTI